MDIMLVLVYVLGVLITQQSVIVTLQNSSDQEFPPHVITISGLIIGLLFPILIPVIYALAYKRSRGDI